MNRASIFAAIIVLMAACNSSVEQSRNEVTAKPYRGNALGEVSVPSLSMLTVEALRKRTFGSSLKLQSQIGDQNGGTDYADVYGATGNGPYDTFMASYDSDGLRLYTRIDIPNAPMPESGYPVVVFCHGWVGIDAAPTFHFSHTPESMYAELIDGYVDAGFVVLTPGYRGHGEVNGVKADGIEFMAAWDNATYVSPTFYAIDVLNLLDGLGSIESLDFTKFPESSAEEVSVDLSRVYLSGHSQGGDVLLTVLAVAGEGGSVKTNIAGAAISDGTFPDRFTQLETYAPMQSSPEAFMSGDGTWTGTATGRDGSVNSNFVFGYPPDWIATVNREEWTWQNDTWSAETVQAAIEPKYAEMYKKLKEHVADVPADAEFSITAESDGRYSVSHDAEIEKMMSSLGPFRKEEFLTEPLLLHYTDRDMYSLPVWNKDLCDRINGAGGACQTFLYPGNNHLMRVSEHEWYSPPGSVESYPYIMRRDIAHFAGRDAAEVTYP